MDAQVNPVSPTVINVMMTLLASGLAFLTAMFFFQRKERLNKALFIEEERVRKAAILEAEHEVVKTRLVELETKLALVDAAVVPISTAFQALLIKELTHFHTQEMDALLVKVGPPNVLTTEEYERLVVMLKERTRDLGAEISESERGAAHILPVVMTRAQVEQETLKRAADLKLVRISKHGSKN
jgi:hypothetical protein